jgi:hypothetical protein
MLRKLVLAAALAAGMAIPAAASAATITLDRPCLRAGAGDKVGVTLVGFAPQSFVSIIDNNGLIDSVRVGDDGGFVGEYSAPAGVSATGRDVHTVIARGDGGLETDAQYTLIGLKVGMNPGKAKSTTKVKFLAQGFVEAVGKPLYAHFTYAKNQAAHKLVKTVKLGTLQGPCGTLTSAKLTQLPLKKPKSGPYVIQFDTSPAFKLQQGVYVERSVFVYPKRKR